MEIPSEFRQLDLYDTLKVNKDADAATIRKAYLRRALRTHPDKTGGDDQEFRKVAFAHSILSNESQRKHYDKTGTLDFDDNLRIADLFSRDFRVEITSDMIEEDKRNYQHSQEETEDLLRLYRKFNGNFDRISETLIHSTFQDNDRLIDQLNAAIQSDEIKGTPEFKKTTAKKHLKKRESELKREAKIVEKDRKLLGLDTEAGLAALIQQRQLKRNGDGASFFDKLEAKYSVNKGRKK